jgi:hypothetical protein
MGHSLQPDQICFASAPSRCGGIRRASRAAIWSALALMVAAQPANAQDIMAYPTKGQSADQQKQDRYECHVWASEQSGYDPTKGPPAAPTAAAPPPPAPAPPPPPEGGAVRGAARGAAVGAVGGAIAGDAGKGAAIGAASGALIGGMRRRDQQRQAAAYQQSQQRAAAPAPAANAAADSYRRAMSACLQGRGYTVS